MLSLFSERINRYGSKYGSLRSIAVGAPLTLFWYWQDIEYGEEPHADVGGARKTSDRTVARGIADMHERRRDGF